MIGYLNIDDTQETLVSSFELALIKDLHCDDGRILDRAERLTIEKLEQRTGRVQEQDDGHIKAFIPIGIEGFLDHACCVSLF
jgi:hypothetical protein